MGRSVKFAKKNNRRVSESSDSSSDDERTYSRSLAKSSSAGRRTTQNTRGHSNASSAGNNQYRKKWIVTSQPEMDIAFIDDDRSISIQDFFNGRYWHFSVFALFELINIIAAWYVNHKVNNPAVGYDPHGPNSMMRFGGAMAREFVRHAVNPEDIWWYPTLAFMITMASLYIIIILWVMRNTKHAPIVMFFKGLIAFLCLSTVIYENAFGGSIFKAIGLDIGYTMTGVYLFLAVFNLVEAALLYIWFFVQSEKDAEYRQKLRQQALLAASSPNRQRSGGKSSSYSSDSDSSDSDSDDDLESGKKRSKNSSKKQPVVEEKTWVGGAPMVIGQPVIPGGGSYSYSYTTTYGSAPQVQTFDLPPPPTNGEATVYRLHIN